MKTRRPLPRPQLMFTAVLFLLALLAAILWFADPSHRPTGGSRIHWPPPSPAKP